MVEPFANERKNIMFESGRLTIFRVLFVSFGVVQPTPSKTANKAENHSKEGPINTTVGKSGVTILWQELAKFGLTLYP